MDGRTLIWARLGLAATLAVASGVVASKTTAASSPSGPTLGGNVTEISDPGAFFAIAPGATPLLSQPDPINSRYYIVQGSIDASGSYHYPVTLASSNGGPVVVRELSSDQPSHQELVVVGYTTAQQIQSVIAQDPAGVTGGGTGATTSSTGPSPMFPSPGSSSHYMYTRWYDPLSITLTSAYDEADIWWNSSAVMTNWAWDYYLTWNTNNGWSLIYNNSYPQLLYNNQGLATFSYARMRTSSWFPSPTCGTTTTYYAPNEIETWIGGSRTYYVDTWATSGCLFLLHWEYYVV